MNKKIFLIIAAACFASLLLAGNSVFSFYGMPYQFYGTDTYSMGMGDAGSSDVFRYNTGYANPAQHSRTNRSLFSTGLLMGYTNYVSETNGKQSFRDNSLDLPYFSISIPYRAHRFGFQFNSLSSGVMNNQVSIADTDIIEKHGIDRYMYRADLIYGWQYRNLLLGVSGNYYFGHDIHRFAQEAGYGTFNTLEKLSQTYKNPSVTFGSIYANNSLAIGAYFTKGAVLKGEQIRSSIHETEPATDFEYELPHHINAAVTLLPIKDYKVAIDVDFEPWSSVHSALNDSYKLSFGIAKEPKKEEYSHSWKSLPFRLGISYRLLPFKAVATDPQDIQELSASCGLSIPLQKEANRIDLGFRYSKRGDLADNKMQDTAYMLILGFTGFDIITKSADRTSPRFIPEAEELSE